ncbi:RasGAP protein [Linderina macrospora]|uniref:RasGAP protein n=1 Tax=Linderina macrospora TaxID=4868 RepID=A0ACC1JCL8_9FUNG|nr:RasGAP protein [Linderina macrospora]
MGKGRAQAEPESNDESATSKDEGTMSFCGYKQKAGRARARTQASDQSTISSSSPPDSHGQGWLGRMIGTIRRKKTASQNSASDTPPHIGQERGAIAVGTVKDPNMAIPADIMFSARRAQLYGTMMRLLMHNPYYLSRVISHVKYHECDALLSIVLDSVFRGPVHEQSLTLLFTEIIGLEVERTTSIDTVMRNDAPSVHMLSAYLKKPSCLEYLQKAVGPTIETVVELGNASLESELGSVYQDWARSQESRKLPPIVSVVEAGGYTEVQNLSRRRQRQLVHLTTHCLHDIINARLHVPMGLVSICASTLRATRQRFPDADDAKAYSLVGGIFFLRFVNAALASPNIYGLVDASPTGQVKTNLKLVARLMQRLSNYSAKPADEWPADARGFIESNVHRFHGFLASLTTACGQSAAGFTTVSPAPLQPPTADVHQNGSKEHSPGTVQPVSGIPIDQVTTSSTVSAKSLPAHLSCSLQTAVRKSQSPADTDIWPPSLPPRNAPSEPPPEPSIALLPSLPPEDTTVEMGIADSGWAGSTADLDKPTCDAAMPSRLDIALVPTGSTVAGSARTSGDSPARPWPGKLPAIVKQASSDYPQRTSLDGRKSESSTSRTSPVRRKITRRSPEYISPGLCIDEKRQRGRSESTLNDVVLPLNDLYLLQKYLEMYQDAWTNDESRMATFKADQTPMQDCLRSLGMAPPLVRQSNNHLTRIPLV